MTNHPNRTSAAVRRAQVCAILEQSNNYDAATMQISRDGLVTALKDADKTYAGNDSIRYAVGHIDDLLATGSV